MDLLSFALKKCDSDSIFDIRFHLFSANACTQEMSSETGKTLPGRLFVEDSGKQSHDPVLVSDDDDEDEEDQESGSECSDDPWPTTELQAERRKCYLLEVQVASLRDHVVKQQQMLAVQLEKLEARQTTLDDLERRLAASEVESNMWYTKYNQAEGRANAAMLREREWEKMYQEERAAKEVVRFVQINGPRPLPDWMQKSGDDSATVTAGTTTTTSDNAGEKRKQRTDSAAEKLFDVTWECSVCYAVLGVDSGVVPMVSIDCRPTAHMLCSVCVERPEMKRRIQTSSGGSGPLRYFCPQCNVPTSGYIPLRELVDEDSDAAARAILLKYDTNRHEAEKLILPLPKRVRAHSPDRSNENAQGSAQRRVPVAPSAAILQQRIEHIVARVSKETGSILFQRFPRGLSLWDDAVPDWDSSYVRLKCRQPGFPTISSATLAAELGAMAAELQPKLDEIYSDSPYKVVMADKQVAKPDVAHARPRFAYLVFHLEQRRQSIGVREIPNALATALFPQPPLPNSSRAQAPAVQPPLQERTLPVPIDDDPYVAISVMMPWHQQCCFVVRCSETTLDLKEKICDRGYAELHQVRLTFRGVTMEDAARLSLYGIVGGSTIDFERPTSD